jgi:hypothetical protein
MLFLRNTLPLFVSLCDTHLPSDPVRYRLPIPSPWQLRPAGSRGVGPAARCPGSHGPAGSSRLEVVGVGADRQVAGSAWRYQHYQVDPARLAGGGYGDPTWWAPPSAAAAPAGAYTLESAHLMFNMC